MKIARGGGGGGRGVKISKQAIIIGMVVYIKIATDVINIQCSVLFYELCRIEGLH